MQNLEALNLCILDIYIVLKHAYTYNIPPVNGASDKWVPWYLKCWAQTGLELGSQLIE